MKRFIFSILLTLSFVHAADFPAVNAPLIKPTTLMTPEMKAQHPNTPVCMFARKDYDSAGFSIPKRDGMKIKGQFGCIYYCGCQGKAYYVTYALREEHFDAQVWSQETGGPSRAKWFICPHSVENSTWNEMHDEVGRIIGYSVEPDVTFFEPRYRTDMKIIQKWEALNCK